MNIWKSPTMVASWWLLILIFLLCVPPLELSSVGDEGNPNSNLTFVNSSNEEVANGLRSKRNYLTNNSLGNPTMPGNTVEGLLASCQLTNLLLYQLLQQKVSPIGMNPMAPFGAAGGLVNNFLIPPPLRTTTIISTSSYVTTMSSQDIVTIALLFGNKPSPTIITRTKTYEVQTSDIITITSTIEPTTTTSVVVTPTQTPPTISEPIVPAVEENDIGFSDNENSERPYKSPDIPNVSENYESNRFQQRNKFRPLSARNTERKVLRANPATTPNYLHTVDYADRTPAFKYGSSNYFQRKSETTPVESYLAPEVKGQRTFKNVRVQSYLEDSSKTDNGHGYLHDARSKEYSRERAQNIRGQSPLNLNEDASRNYYVVRRRLKRLQQLEQNGDEDPEHLEREFLLEPSFESSSVDYVDTKCPPPSEVTITKTITKFVNPPSALAPAAVIVPRFVKSSSSASAVSPTRSGRRFSVLSSSSDPQLQFIPRSTTEDIPVKEVRGRLRSRFEATRGDILSRGRISTQLETTTEISKTTEMEGRDKRRKFRRPSTY